MKVNVNYYEVAIHGAALKNDAKRYGDCVQCIYAKTSEIEAAWQGSDASAYISQLETFRPVLNEMQMVVENYGIYLDRCAQSYMTLQNQRAASARSL